MGKLFTFEFWKGKKRNLVSMLAAIAALGEVFFPGLPLWSQLIKAAGILGTYSLAEHIIPDKNLPEFMRTGDGSDRTAPDISATNEVTFRPPEPKP